MTKKIILIHNKQKIPASTKIDSKWIKWETCLRQIFFGFEGWDYQQLVTKNTEIFKGTEALKFCLEVVCGLHSPIVGETEVYGQFKNLFKNFFFPNNLWGKEFQKFIKEIFTYAKIIRQKHLINLGSRSYGSVTRKYVKGFQTIHLLGAGQLAKEILPWISKDNNNSNNDVKVNVYCRNQNQREEIKKQFPNASTYDLTKLTNQINQPDTQYPLLNNKKIKALIIAAPLSSKELYKFSLQNFEMIIDLRGESKNDPILNHKNVISLESFFKHINSNKIQINKKTKEAHNAIQSIIIAKNKSILHRPFGWEELCG